MKEVLKKLDTTHVTLSQMLEEAVDYLMDKVFMDESKSVMNGLESLRLLLEKALIEAKKDSLNVSELKCSQEASVRNCEDTFKLVKNFLIEIGETQMKNDCIFVRLENVILEQTNRLKQVKNKIVAMESSSQTCQESTPLTLASSVSPSLGITEIDIDACIVISDDDDN